MNRPSDHVTTLVDFIVSHKGGALFHVTDERNLRSIGEHGLLSKKEAHNRIDPAHPGGSDLTRALDSQYLLDDYVFLGFNKVGVMPKHDDERQRRPRILHVDPNILRCRGVKIALGRANHARTEVFGVWRAVQEMDWQVFAGDYDPDDIWIRSRVHKVFNYEILVPTSVPPEYIIAFE
jgi:hypothetical protein